MVLLLLNKLALVDSEGRMSDQDDVSPIGQWMKSDKGVRKPDMCFAVFRTRLPADKPFALAIFETHDEYLKAKDANFEDMSQMRLNYIDSYSEKCIGRDDKPKVLFFKLRDHQTRYLISTSDAREHFLTLQVCRLVFATP